MCITSFTSDLVFGTYVRKPNRMVHTEIFSTKHYTNLVQLHLIKISYSDLTEATTWLYGSSNMYKLGTILLLVM